MSKITKSKGQAAAGKSETPSGPAGASMRGLINQGYEEVTLDRIHEHPMNPRRGDVAAIVKSIAVNGFYGAVVAQVGTGYVLAGNHRLMAARDAGLRSLPVIWVEVDEVEAQRILLADNRTSDMGGYDIEQLAALLDGLAQSYGLDGTGYERADLDAILAGLTPPDANEWAAAVGALTDSAPDQATITIRVLSERRDEILAALDDLDSDRGEAIWRLIHER